MTGTDPASTRLDATPEPADSGSDPVEPDAVTAGTDGDRFFRVVLAVIAVGALLLRFAYVILGQRDWDIGAGDSFYYFRGAQLLLDGHGFVAPHQFDDGIVMEAASHPPLYLLFLAAVSVIGLVTPLQQMLASSLIGVGSVVLAGLVGRRVGGDRVGLIAAAIVAVYPQIWVSDGMLMSETAAIFFGLLTLLTAYRFHEHRSLGRAAAMGLALGLAALSRSELILLSVLVCVPLCLAPRGADLGHRIRTLAVTGLSSLLLVAPWVGYNLSRFEHPVYLSAGLDITQAVSNCDTTYDGPLLGYWDYWCQFPIDDAAEARGLTRHEESVRARYMGEYVRDYVGSHLRDQPKVIAARLGRIAGVYRGAQQLDFDSFTEARPRRAAELAAWGYWTILPLAIAGGVIARRRRELLYPLLAVIGTVVFAVVITFAGTRYRAPAEPVFAILAAVFLDWTFFRRGTAVTSTPANLPLRPPVPIEVAAPTADVEPDVIGPDRPAVLEPVGSISESDAPTESADAVDPAAKGRLPALEGLRGLAAIAVLTSHVSIATGIARPERLSGPVRAFLPRLDVGVAVFFVLSGFLLFRPFVRSLLERRDNPPLRGYLVRRFVRIYPLYWLVLLVTIAANRMQGLDPERFSGLPSFGEFLSYASLLHIHRPETAIAPVGQAWSLGTEVTFYLFLPVFGALLARALRKVDDDHRRARAIAVGLGILVLVGVATKALVALGTDPDNMTTRGMYTTWLPYNLDLFAAGMALALIAVWRERSNRPVLAWLDDRRLAAATWIGAALAFIVVSHFTGLRPDHLSYTDIQLFTRQFLYGAVGVLLLLPAIFGTRHGGTIRRMLTSRLLLVVGAASYGIYLWHQLIGAEYYHLLRHQIFNTAFWPAWIAILIASITTALLTHRLVEEPFVRLGRRLSTRRH